MAALLQLVSDVFLFITTTQVHPTYFPYLIAPTLHAARVSIAFQANARKAQSRGLPAQNWGTYLAGYLVMAWGGTLSSHVLLSLPPPPLYSFHPYINYLSTHLLLTLVFNYFPNLLDSTQALDTFIFPLDAILRVNSITSTLTLLSIPISNSDPLQIPSPTPITISPSNPLLSTSPLFRLILGAVACAGGSVSASTLSTWTSDWRVTTPAFLTPLSRGWKGGALGSLDVWSGALAGLIYDMLTACPAYQGLLMRIPELSVMDPVQAKAVAVLFLSGCHAWKASVLVSTEESARGRKVVKTKTQ